MSVSSDRWTCPQCPPGHGTVVVVGSDADIAACIKAAQLRHGEGHAQARRVLAHLGVDEPDSSTIKKGNRAMFHDSHDDVSAVHEPDAGHREAMDLLGMDPDHHRRVRMSDADWATVNRVRDALAAARAVPAPRSAQQPLAAAQ